MNVAAEEIGRLSRLVDALQGRIRALEYDRDGLTFFRADKDNDSDFDPLTDASWEGVTPAASGTIDWNAVFGVPKRARAVLAYVSGTISFKAKSTTTNTWSTTGEQRVAPVAGDGTTYWHGANGTVTVRVLGWWA